MTEETPSTLLDSGPLVSAEDSTTPTTVTKRALDEKESPQRQMKKPRIDAQDVVVVEDENDDGDSQNTVNCSEETVKYSWDDDADWMKDDYFDSVVKSGSQNSVRKDTEKTVPQEADLIELNGEEDGGLVSSTKSAADAANHHDVVDVDSLPEKALENSKGSCSKIGNGGTEAACAIEVTDCECENEVTVVSPGDTTPGGLFPPPQSDKLVPGKPNIKKLTSVMKDAEMIGELLNIANLNLLYEKVKQRRGVPNRVEVVTNEILERGIDEIENEIKAQYKKRTADDEIAEELLAEMEHIIAHIREKESSTKVDPNDVYALLESKKKKVPTATLR